MKALLLLAIVNGLLAAPPAPPAPAAKPERQSLRIPFWVSEGTPVGGQELQVKVNGKTIKVARVAGVQEDLLLLLIVDWAGDLSLVDPAREALIEQIGKLPPNVQVGLLRSQDGLRVLLDPGTDRKQLEEALRALSVSGRAGLLNSIEPIQRLGDRIASKSKVRVAALFVSDSVITNYREDYTNPVVNSSDSGDMSRRFPEALIQEKIRQLSKTVTTGETPIFAVHLNYQSDRMNTAYQTGLLDLAVSSGGAAEFCRTVAEIPAAIEKVLASILTIQRVETEWQPGKRKQMEVILEAEGRRLHFRARRQLPDRSTAP